MSTHISQNKNFISHFRRINSFLGNNRELIKIASVKLFTSNYQAIHWLDTELEGFLVFVVDRHYKSKFFVLYDYHTYEKLFEMELYIDFNKYYTELEENFHCFELGKGFIAFKFLDVNGGAEFKNTILAADDRFVANILNNMKNKDNKDVINNALKHLVAKSSYLVSQNTTKEFKSEVFLFNERNFRGIKGIILNKEKKTFKISTDEAVDDYLEFRSISLRSSRRKNANMSKNNHVVSKHKLNPVNRNAKKSAPVIPNIPPVPNIPNIPNFTFPKPHVAVNKETQDSNKPDKVEVKPVVVPIQEEVEETPTINKQDEILKVVLKKAQKEEKDDTTQVQTKGPASMLLTYAIKQRLEDMGNIKKNNDDSDSDWSN